MTVAITLTTIHEPLILKSFAENFKKYGHNDVEIIVVGDKKTPTGSEAYCQKISGDFGIPIHYLGVEWQVNYMERFPDFDKHIPFNSFARRNIGDLFAYEKGYTVIIRVDDDNFPTDDDFIKYHQVVCQEQEMDVISSSNGWFNICESLTDKDRIPFYPRGFPYSVRWKKTETHVEKKVLQPAINAGLWLGDPDVDAVTRLAKAIDATTFEETWGKQFALLAGTWCPINTQNTAYDRKLIPAAFVSPYVGRYDDIWSGYLLRRIMDHMGDYVAYGRPLLMQERNPHNLWSDLELEMNGNLYTDHLIQCLKEIELSGQDYLPCYYELAEKLDERISDNQEVFKKVTDGMKVWSNALQRIA